MISKKLTLHMKSNLLSSGFNLARLLASSVDLSWSNSYRLLEQFEMSTKKTLFVKAIADETAAITENVNPTVLFGDNDAIQSYWASAGSH